MVIRRYALSVVLLLVAACTTTNGQLNGQQDVETTEDIDVDSDVEVTGDTTAPDVDATADADTTADADASEEGPECEIWEDEPVGLLLTWQRDPTSTMTIDWHTEGDGENRLSLCYRPVGATHWTAEVQAEHHEVSLMDRTVHRAELTDLQAGAEYEFQVGQFGRVYRFRTMPSDIDDEPLVFATGGDTQHTWQLFEATNQVAMEYEPQFIAWGGDLAYADAGQHSAHDLRWRTWFEVIHDTLIDDDGRVVPILVAPGNHEVVDGYYFQHDQYEQSDGWRQQMAPYFFEFFAFPGQPGYGELDFGDYMTLIFLDTDHTNPIDGEQTQWLDEVLSERKDREVAHVFPFYHVPAYPSHRDPEGATETRVRENWVPLFEEYGLSMVFENHDHTYKRTHPIRAGQIDEDDGIVYVGDGAWGVLPRSGSRQDEWYIDRFASANHAVIVTVHQGGHQVVVVDIEGEIIDEFGVLPD